MITKSYTDSLFSLVLAFNDLAGTRLDLDPEAVTNSESKSRKIVREEL